eukprot:740-Amphidinium_carterae.1
MPVMKTVMKKPAASKSKALINKAEKQVIPPSEVDEENADMLDDPSDPENQLASEVEQAEDPPASEPAPSQVLMADPPSVQIPAPPSVQIPAPRTPPDTPGATGSMGSDQNQVAVKTEPMSKHEARAAQQKMLTYLKRDVGKGSTDAQ